MSQDLYTIADVMDIFSISRSSVYRRIEDGTLPLPIKIGTLSRFIGPEIDAAIEKIAARKGGAV